MYTGSTLNEQQSKDTNDCDKNHEDTHVGSFFQHGFILVQGIGIFRVISCIQ